jgi:hypothetical protein
MKVPIRWQHGLQKLGDCHRNSNKNSMEKIVQDISHVYCLSTLVSIYACPFLTWLSYRVPLKCFRWSINCSFFEVRKDKVASVPKYNAMSVYVGRRSNISNILISGFDGDMWSASHSAGLYIWRKSSQNPTGFRTLLKSNLGGTLRSQSLY